MTNEEKEYLYPKSKPAWVAVAWSTGELAIMATAILTNQQGFKNLIVGYVWYSFILGWLCLFITLIAKNTDTRPKWVKNLSTTADVIFMFGLWWMGFILTSIAWMVSAFCAALYRYRSGKPAVDLEKKDRS